MPDLIRKPAFSFHKKLFLTIVSTFLVFVFCISLFQYKREKAFRIDLMTEQIQSYNNLIYEVITKDGLCDSCIHNTIGFLKVSDLRITIIDYSGKVLYDSEAENLGNHSDRPEFKEALATGAGVSVRRKSESTGKTFFYAATRYPNFIIRCSRPYDTTLNKQLQVDYNFIVFTCLVLLIMLLFLYRITHRLGNAIDQLRDFAENADSNRFLDIEQEFPQNELGEISQHIVGLFRRISSTRDDLMVEREKLITHLQTAREGLAVFAPDKKEIIANNLFMQYINLISDEPVQTASYMFQLPELNEINLYIQQTLDKKSIVGSMQRQSIQLNKNSRVFQIQCIIFQDKSFEVSINDISQTEEESRLKRQLTQNIAHELKTPISSIQGYMETIINNPDLPADKLKNFVERSYLQSKRLSELLRDISTLTRMDEAPNMIEKEDINISRLIEQISGELEAEMNQKDIKLTTEIDPSLTVNGNITLLYSVFRNLMDNSLAYAGEHTEMALTCFRNDPERCFFNFYDTGTGVAEEHLNRIFERFYRVDKGRTRKLGGTGLGLAIVKNAVQLHGGTISAKNRPEGGLEFVFSMMK
jgi:signal transduction histidine kinase